MDILSQLINGMTRTFLPQGHDHSQHDPGGAAQSGRVDVILSHAIAGQMSSAHPVVQALYQGSRAVIDGALTSVAGPVAIEGIIRSGASALGYAPQKSTKRVSTKKKKTTAAVVKRNPRAHRAKEYTSKGIEILDAEFVDVPTSGGIR